jgi:hypothetical protein
MEFTGQYSKRIRRSTAAALLLACLGLSAALQAGTVHAATGGDACNLTVRPTTVSVGHDFSVSGNFSNAQIYQLAGANAVPSEDSEPVAASAPHQAFFRFRFHAEPQEVGIWTIFALVPDTECADSATVTVVNTSPDTAMPRPTAPFAETLGAILVILAFIRVLILGHWLRRGAALRAMRQRSAGDD